MDPADIGRCFEECAAGLLLYARQLSSKNSAPPEDLVQEAFIRLAGQKNRPENPRAWLIHALRNLALDAARGARRRLHRDHRAGRERWFRHSEIEPPAQALAEAGEIQDALLELDPEQREVIVLRIWNDATFEQIAAVMRLPLSTVYLRYRSGLEMLRARWESPCPKK